MIDKTTTVGTAMARIESGMTIMVGGFGVPGTTRVHVPDTGGGIRAKWTDRCIRQNRLAGRKAGEHRTGSRSGCTP